MDKKLIGTAAVIGVVAGYMYSKDVFNSATFAATESSHLTHEPACINGVYNNVPAAKSKTAQYMNYDWAKVEYPPGLMKYKTTIYHHIRAKSHRDKDNNLVTDPAFDKEGAGSKSSKTFDNIQDAVNDGITRTSNWNYNGKNYSKSGKDPMVNDMTKTYCAYLDSIAEEEEPSNQDEEEATVVPVPSNGDEETTAVTSSGSTDWCAIKAKYPARLKEIKGEIAEERIKIKADYVAAVNKVKDLNRKTSEKFEKEGAAELKRIKDRYAESKKNCSAKEEVQKKLQDSGAGEGFWEKLLAYLNA